jgi:hypothetical protein
MARALLICRLERGGDPMKGKVWKIPLTVFVALLPMAVFPSLASAKPVYHDVGTYEIYDFYVDGPEEKIVCGGEIHYNIELVLDNAGGAHWRSSASHNLRGVGLTTGAKYQVVSTETRHYNTRDDGFPYEWTYINTSPLISQGEITNMIFTIRNQVTINANGEITVSFSEISTVFRG